MSNTPSIRKTITVLVLVTSAFGFQSCGSSGLAIEAPTHVRGDTATTPQSQDRYRKLALLVGIDEYKHVSDLAGAVNDVKNMKALLVENFGFPDDAEHIRVLTNEAATRDAIIANIREHLIAKATEETVVVFHYSGHGSRIRDEEDGDETDGMDETIVPHDSGHVNPYPNRDITDDELNYFLGELTAETKNVTFVLDSCHSGTATRAAGLARTVEPDVRPPPERDARNARGARHTSEGKNDLRSDNSSYALISGSAAGELSYEVSVNGKSYGAMSWLLANQIRKVGANATYRDVMDVVKLQVSAKYAVQHPQLEGPGEDQFIFSDKSVEAESSVLISAVSGRSVTLDAGQIHGVTKGSLYDIYAPGSKSFEQDKERVARIEITRVDVVESTANVVEGDVSAASRAVEREHHWPDAVLRVHLKDANRSTTLGKIEEELAAFKHITTMETAAGYDLLVREEAGHIITEGGDPTEISPRVATADADAVSHVVDQLAHWAKWFNILSIGNKQRSQLRVELALTVPENGRDAVRRSIDRDIGLTLLADEQFTIEVSNKSNQNIYIAVLDLSNDGSVAVVYPTQGAEDPVAPGKTWTETLQALVPDGRDSIRDILKVIATTNAADFRFLEQGATRGAPRLPATRGRPRDPLEELLANAAMGTTRGVKRVEVENWITVDRALEVRRPE